MKEITRSNVNNVISIKVITLALNKTGTVLFLTQNSNKSNEPWIRYALCKPVDEDTYNQYEMKFDREIALSLKSEKSHRNCVCIVSHSRR